MISPLQPVTAAVNNAANMSRLVDTSTTGRVDVNNTTDSSSPSTGALHTTGGLGVEKKAYIGTDLSVGNNVAVGGAISAGSTISTTANVSATDISATNVYGQIVTVLLQLNALGILCDNITAQAMTTENITVNKALTLGEELLFTTSDNVQAGADITLSPIVNPLIRLTGAVTSIASIDAPILSKVVILRNVSGSAVIIKNGVGNILTGTGANLTLQNDQVLFMTFDATSAVWLVSSGAGSGAGSLVVSTQVLDGTAGITLSGTDRRRLIKISTTGGEKNLSGYALQITAPANDGDELVLVGQSDDDYVVLNTGNGLDINGEWNSYRNKSLSLTGMNGIWIETPRRG